MQYYDTIQYDGREYHYTDERFTDGKEGWITFGSPSQSDTVLYNSRKHFHTNLISDSDRERWIAHGALKQPCNMTIHASEPMLSREMDDVLADDYRCLERHGFDSRYERDWYMK